jgi:hypothetical protein
VTATGLRDHTEHVTLHVTPFHMPPQPFLTSAGWSLSGLTTQGRNFHEIPRVSVSDTNLDAVIRKHESSGVPLVIEGMREHQAWPTATFDIQWLRRNVEQRELGNLVRWSSGDILARDTSQKCA